MTVCGIPELALVLIAGGGLVASMLLWVDRDRLAIKIEAVRDRIDYATMNHNDTHERLINDLTNILTGDE